VKGELGRGDTSLTLLFFANATGGLIASLVVASLADSARATFIFTTSCAAFGISLALVAIAPGFLAIAFMMFIVGLSGGAFQTLNGAVVLKNTDPRYFGRVMSLTFLAFAAFGLVALPLGFLADAIGERATLAVMGISVVVAVIVVNIIARVSPSDPVPTPIPNVGD
jgi:predicted MFS family arabinose efflux permease